MARIAFEVKSPSWSTLRALNYTPEIEQLRAASRKRAVPLRAMASRMGPAYGSVFTRLDCEPPYGIELLSQSDMFAFAPSGRRIRRDSLPEPGDHLIERGQVLLAGAGTLGETELYGRSLIADNRVAGKYVGPDAYVISFSDGDTDLALFAYAFLCTRIGVRAIRSTSYGTKVLRFRSDLLGSVPIPEAGKGLVKSVGQLIRLAVEQRELAEVELQRARDPLLQLPEMQNALEMCGARQRRATRWGGALPTFIAWNYASAGEARALLAERWQGRLRDILQPGGLFNGPRFVRIPCAEPYGVEFLSQRDVFLARPQPRRIARPEVEDRMLYVPEETILVASYGQLEEGNLFGRVELAASGPYQYGLAEHLLRVIPKSEYHSICYAFLSTRVGLRLLQSAAIGTSVPVMRPDLVLSIPFPEVSREARLSIDAHVCAGVRARRQAQEAEMQAIRMIEQDVLA